MTPCLIRVEEEVIEEKKSKRELARKPGNRNPAPRLSISGGSDPTLKIIDSKTKWLTLQKKLQ